MQITVVEPNKGDKNLGVQLIVTIYEKDYTQSDHNNVNNYSFPLIHKYSALLRFEFTKSMLNMSLRRKCPPENTVRLHVRCAQLKFSNTFVCPRSWTDSICLGKLPISERRSPEGLMHVVKIHLNLCELISKTYVNLLDDKFFHDIYLVSDDIVPGNVAMHRAVLASHSSLLKKMLLGELKEAKNIKIHIKDASHQTLLDLKHYIYSGILPDKSLVELMEIAKKYSFENLLADCVFEIVNTLGSHDVEKYRQYAIDENIPELLNALNHITTDELTKTVSRQLKVPQTTEKSHRKDADRNIRDSHSQRQDSRTQKQDSHTQRQDSRTQKQDSHTQRQDARTQKQDSHAQKQDARTQKQGSHSQKQDSHTQKQGSHTQKQDSHTQKQGSHTQKQDSHTQKQGSHSQKQDSHTQKQGSHSQRQDSHSLRPDSRTRRRDSESQIIDSNSQRSSSRLQYQDFHSQRPLTRSQSQDLYSPRQGSYSRRQELYLKRQDSHSPSQASHSQIHDSYSIIRRDSESQRGGIFSRKNATNAQKKKN